jgi:hypothetical protein
LRRGLRRRRCLAAGTVVHTAAGGPSRSTRSGGRRLLVGDVQHRALRSVVVDAVADVVSEMDLSPDKATHLRAVLLERDGFGGDLRVSGATEPRAAPCRRGGG